MTIPADAPALRDATFTVHSSGGGQFEFSQSWRALFRDAADNIHDALQILEPRSAEGYEWEDSPDEHPLRGWLLPRTARLGIDTNGRIFRVNNRKRVIEIGIWGLTKRELERIPEGLHRLLIA